MLAVLAGETSTRSLRKLGEYLHAQFKEPWSTLRFWLADGEIQFDDPATGRRFSGRRPGQTVAKPVYRDVRKVEASMRAKVANLRKRNSAQMGKLTSARGVAGGNKVLAGTRVPTEAIWRFHKAGYDVPRIREQYPDLSDADVKAAIEYESKRSGHRAA